MFKICSFIPLLFQRSVILLLKRPSYYAAVICWWHAGSISYSPDVSLRLDGRILMSVVDNTQYNGVSGNCSTLSGTCNSKIHYKSIISPFVIDNLYFWTAHFPAEQIDEGECIPRMWSLKFIFKCYNRVVTT